MLRVHGLLTRRSLLQVSRRGGYQIPWRNASTSAGRFDKGRSALGIVSGGALVALVLSPFYASNIHADAALPAQGSKSLVSDNDDVSLGALIRAYAVFTMCSIPVLVDNSPKLLEFATLPGIRWFAETFVRITFFDQFVGGTTAEKTLPLLYKLRASNKGALFAYSVEVDEAVAMAASTSKAKGQSPHKQIVNEMIHCIDVAADFEDGITRKGPSGRRTWVALKFSALSADPHSLHKLSSHIISTRPTLPTPVPFPGAPHATDLDVLYQPKVPNALTPEEVVSLRELHADLVRICARAQERGVKVIIDAEYSWYQPAIDALTLSLTRQFNKLPDPGEPTSNVQPLVYGTYQAYLRRTPLHLAHALADAKANNYALGVKLVRGAYHPHELAVHAQASDPASQNFRSLSISPEAAPPVWTSRPETDACFNECVRVLVDAVRADVSALWSSSSLPAPSTSSSSSGFFSHIFGSSTPKDNGNSKRSRVPTIGVLFGTHNWYSSELILEELVHQGLAFKVPREKDGKDESVVIGEDVAERMAVGQLYGMSDELTNHLVDKTVSHTPFIIKYIPYGAVADVMPYLSRRAIENKSVLGDGTAANERRRAGAEIRKRIRGLFGGI